MIQVMAVFFCISDIFSVPCSIGERGIMYFVLFFDSVEKVIGPDLPAGIKRMKKIIFQPEYLHCFSSVNHEPVMPQLEIQEHP